MMNESSPRCVFGGGGGGGGVIYTVRCIENITLLKNRYGYCRLKVNER